MQQSGALRFSEEAALLLNGRSDGARLGPAADFLGDGTDRSFTLEGYFLVLPELRGNYWFESALLGASADTNGCSGSPGSVVAVQFTGTAQARLMFALPHGPEDNCQDTTSIISNALDLGRWYHFAATYNANEAKMALYLDGLLVGTDTWDGGDPIEWNTDLHLGRGGSNRDFHGVLDEIRISAGEKYTDVFAPPVAPLAAEGDTVRLFHFDEAGRDPRFSGRFRDDSGNNGHGTIQGTPVFVRGLPALDQDLPLALQGGTPGSRRGVLLERGTTNLFRNPGFESSGLTDWAVGGGITASTTSGPGRTFSGTTAALLANAQDVNGERTLLAPATPSSAKVTLSFHVYRLTTGNVGGVVDNVVTPVFNGFGVTGGYEAMGGGWWRVVASATVAQTAGSYGLMLAAGETVLVDAFQLEGDVPTSYADGALGSGYVGSSSAHQRAAAVLVYDATHIRANAGTIRLWYQPVFSSSEQVDRVAPLVTSGDLSLRYQSDSGGNSAFVLERAGGGNVMMNVEVSRNTWYHVVARWSDQDGLALAINDNNNTDGDTTPVTVGNVRVGSNGNGTAFADGIISGLLIHDRWLNDDDVRQLYRR
ncbi:MAG: LamG-like jellyroll fold domain-containing protein [Myxococcota bacterium]